MAWPRKDGAARVRPAEQELRRALELDPSNIGPLRDLVGVLYLSGNYSRTIKAIDLLPTTRNAERTGLVLSRHQLR